MVKPLLTLLATAVLLTGTGLVDTAEAGDRRHGRKHRRADARIEYRHDGYFRGRDVVVIREYYQPSHRALPPGLRRHYARRGHLPRGWAGRVRPIPVHVERHLPAPPRGYRRGIIDGHAVIYDRSGFILDIAVLF